MGLDVEEIAKQSIASSQSRFAKGDKFFGIRIYNCNGKEDFSYMNNVIKKIKENISQSNAKSEFEFEEYSPKNGIYERIVSLRKKNSSAIIVLLDPLSSLEEGLSREFYNIDIGACRKF
ncbi:MAG: hypothetical protein V1660_01970 [archaeon]